VGVRVTHKKGRKLIEKTFYADIIISNAGARATYAHMIPEGVHLPFEQTIRYFPDGTANVTLYLGLKSDPSKLGVQGENYWIYDGIDHDAIYAQRNALVEGEVAAAYVSFPSMKNPAARGHTAEIIAFLDAGPFIQWEDEPWRRRGEDYEQLKDRISDALVSFVEEQLPGFEELIEYRELATPITTEHFTNHRNGAIYGLPSIPEKFKASWLGPTTPVRNLYLTGSDAASFGVVGSMMSSVLATAVALRRPWKVMNFMSKAIQYSHQLHSQHASITQTKIQPDAGE
jgi:phytoene dehydrogenase-like protein